MAPTTSKIEFTEATRGEATAAKKAWGLTPESLTEAGLAGLAAAGRRGLATLSLAMYLSEQAGTKREAIKAATGLSDQRVSAGIKAGRLIARCGTAGPDVVAEATAVGEQYNAKRTAEAFAGLTGEALAAKIRSERAVLAKEQAKRQGRLTADEREAAKKAKAAEAAKALQEAIKAADARRTPEQRVAAVVAEQRKITTVKATVGTKRGVADMLAQAVRIAALVGMTAEDVATVIAEATAEVAAA